MKLVAAKVFLWLQLLNHAHAFIYSLDQNVSNPVCSWDSRTNTCGNDADAMINLLTRSGRVIGHTFADLMTCALATAESVCNGLTTCIWENDACRVSAAVLLDTISSCYGQTSSSVRKCQEQLQTVGNTTTWIDRSSVRPIQECESTVGEFPVYCLIGFQYCQYIDQTCGLIETALECSRHPSYCIRGNSEFLGYKLISDIRYIMGLSSSSYVLETSFMEEYLDVKSGNLALYNNCGRLKKNETCETKLEVPTPPRISPPPPKSSESSSSLGIILGSILGIFGILSPICCVCAICRLCAAPGDSSRATQEVEMSGGAGTTAGAPEAGTTTGAPEAAVGAGAAVVY
eukprot:TRINITY_DN458_c0_g1_i3.p1 TRINITY_DN458_c0_g1~~TRINITY_DN458_c0_g1_i3.p1  ORF type:complete len:345 (+),score=49.36 TRINITY_DN458_c0_g1_i3:158-1192(+)